MTDDFKINVYCYLHVLTWCVSFLFTVSHAHCQVTNTQTQNNRTSDFVDFTEFVSPDSVVVVIATVILSTVTKCECWQSEIITQPSLNHNWRFEISENLRLVKNLFLIYENSLEKNNNYSQRILSHYYHLTLYWITVVPECFKDDNELEKREIRSPVPQKPLNRSSPKFAWLIISLPPKYATMRIKWLG